MNLGDLVSRFGNLPNDPNFVQGLALMSGQDPQQALVNHAQLQAKQQEAQIRKQQAEMQRQQQQAMQSLPDLMKQMAGKSPQEIYSTLAPVVGVDMAEQIAGMAQKQAEMQVGNRTLDIRQQELDARMNQPDLPEGYMWDSKKQAAMPIPGIDQQAQQIDVEGEGKLRREISGLTTDFRIVSDAFNRINAVAKQPSAAGDLSMIFSYMKLLDPQSVVRESEFATAQNTAGVPERIRNTYNKLLTGERLSEGQRADFIKQAEAVYGSQLNGYNQRASYYRGLAEQYGFNPDRIAKIIEAPSGGAAPDSQGSTDQSQGEPQFIRNPQTGEIRQLINGKWEPFNG